MSERTIPFPVAWPLRGVTPPSAQDLALQLSAGRSLIAAAILAAPVTFVRLLGADTATAARVTWLTRMMAVHDGAIGVGGLAAARRRSGAAGWIAAGAASDATDALVVLGAVRAGRLNGPVARATVPVAAGLAAVGAVTAVRQRGR